MNLFKIVLPVALAFATSNVYAVDSNNTDFPVGLWDTYHHKVNNKTKQTSRTSLRITVCIQPDGTWQSINSADNMGGRWTRLGNDVHLSGNGIGVGGTGSISLVTPYKEMSGNWQSWPINKPNKAHTTYESKWLLKSTTTCVIP